MMEEIDIQEIENYLNKNYFTSARYKISGETFIYFVSNLDKTSNKLTFSFLFSSILENSNSNINLKNINDELLVKYINEFVNVMDFFLNYKKVDILQFFYTSTHIGSPNITINYNFTFNRIYSKNITLHLDDIGHFEKHEFRKVIPIAFGKTKTIYL